MAREIPAARLEAQAVVRDLLGRGETVTSIGRSIGRNHRLIAYVREGRKGESLLPALQRLRDELDARGEVGGTVEPVRLNTAPIRRQRVRGSVQRAGGRSGDWSTSSVGRQAARNGALGLMGVLRRAAEDDRMVAFDVTFTRRVQVSQSPKRPQPVATKKAGVRGQTVTMGPFEARWVFDRVEQDGGGVTAFVLRTLQEEGRLGDGATPADVLGIELRTW